MRSLTLCCALILTVAACSKDKGGDSGTKADSARAAKPMLDSLNRPIGPVTREATVSRRGTVNGQVTVEGFPLVTPPPTFPVRFTTYTNGNIQTAYAKIGSLATATFSPTSTTGNQNAYVQVQIDSTALPAPDPAGSIFKAMTAGRKLSAVKTDTSAAYPWSSGAVKFHFTEEGKQYAGSVIVGRRGPFSYRFYTQYPTSMQSEMADRLRTILISWRWEDDYTYLVPAPPKPAPLPGDTAKTVTAPAATPKKPGK